MAAKKKTGLNWTLTTRNAPPLNVLKPADIGMLAKMRILQRKLNRLAKPLAAKCHSFARSVMKSGKYTRVTSIVIELPNGKWTVGSSAPLSGNAVPVLAKPVLTSKGKPFGISYQRYFVPEFTVPASWRDQVRYYGDEDDATVANVLKVFSIPSTF